MSTIEGLGERTVAQIQAELPEGGRFVVYRYAISLVVVTLRLSSGVQYVPPGRSRVQHGFRWNLITIFLGWWGIPWGPIYSIQSLVGAFRGGEDVTLEVMGVLVRHAQATDTSQAGTALAERMPRRASIRSSETGSIDFLRRPDGDLLLEQRTIAADGGTSVIVHVPAGEVPRLRDALHAGEDEDLVPALRRQAEALAEHGPPAWLRGHDVMATVLRG